jgi:hypothetical protein
MGRKKEQSVDEILAEIDQGKVSSVDGFSSSTALCYFSYASVVSVLPAYLFSSVFDLTNLPVVAVVTLVSALLLTLGYRNVATATRGRLVFEVNQSGAKGKGADYEKLVNQSITSQASNWAFFWNNAIFAGIFVFLAFYALGNVEIVYRYAVSVGISSFLVWQFSSAN